MFPSAYFADRYFAPRFWAKVEDETPEPSIPPRVLADISAAGVTVHRITGSVEAVRRITGSLEVLS